MYIHSFCYSTVISKESQLTNIKRNLKMAAKMIVHAFDLFTDLLTDWVKNGVVGCWRGYLAWGADLHIAQQMPLPLTISCSSKSRMVLTLLVLPFWYMLTRVVPDIFQKSSKMVVCVCVFLRQSATLAPPTKQAHCTPHASRAQNPHIVHPT